ncbi:MAG: hypothetical protein Q9187_001448 [Circinaria calcarea]
MALPPEKVVLRKKRGQETVEVLFLQRQKRLRTDFQYYLDSNETISHASHTSSGSTFDIPRVPTIRVTQAHEDHVNTDRSWQSNGQDPQYEDRAEAANLFQNVLGETQNGLRTTVPKREPRAFYLTVRAPFVPLQPPAGYNGVQTRKRKQRSDLAVFAEKRAKVAEEVVTQETDRDVDMNDLDGMQSYHDIIGSGDALPRKRPGATKEELRWRVENWDKVRNPTESTDTNATRSRTSTARFTRHTEEDSMKLAEELHHLAMLETCGGKVSLRQSGATSDGTGLKFQPKPPPQRHGGRDYGVVQSTENVNAEADPDGENGNGDGDSGEWSYHTYTRRPNPSQITSSDGTTHVDPLRDLDMGKVGLLVIQPEDEEIWETYVGDEDGDSDKDWNSEEEDENAEDFYGNDYPEDEVDSDDEYGLGAYKHRYGASDDEEYDDDNGSWSDEDVEELKLWKSRLSGGHGEESHDGNDGDGENMDCDVIVR